MTACLLPLPIPIASWADQAEEEELSNSLKKQKKHPPRTTSTNEEGRKIFVGGLSFSDVEGKDKLKEERVKKYTQIFHKFGKVSRIQGHWSAKYLF